MQVKDLQDKVFTPSFYGDRRVGVSFCEQLHDPRAADDAVNLILRTDNLSIDIAQPRTGNQVFNLNLCL